MAREDLVPITSTERAKELGSKGGRVRSLAKRMIHRKNCASGCPLFVNCWAKHTSHNLYEKAVEAAEKAGLPEKEIKKIKPQCALKSLPSQVIEGAKRIIMDGEEGFNNEMMEQVMRYKNDIIIGTTTPRERERYLYQLREVKKSIYGDKSRIEGLSKEKGLTANDFAEAYEISKRKKKEDEQKRKEIDRDKSDNQAQGDRPGPK